MSFPKSIVYTKRPDGVYRSSLWAVASTDGRAITHHKTEKAARASVVRLEAAHARACGEECHCVGYKAVPIDWQGVPL